MAKQDVVVVGFKLNTPEPPVQALQRVFGIDQDTAKRLIQRLPKAVKRGVSEEEAAHFANALRAIGAKVEVRASTAQAQGAGQPQAPAPAPRTRQATASYDSAPRAAPAAPQPVAPQAAAPVAVQPVATSQPVAVQPVGAQPGGAKPIAAVTPAGKPISVQPAAMPDARPDRARAQTAVLSDFPAPELLAQKPPAAAGGATGVSGGGPASAPNHPTQREFAPQRLPTGPGVDSLVPDVLGQGAAPAEPQPPPAAVELNPSHARAAASENPFASAPAPANAANAAPQTPLTDEEDPFGTPAASDDPLGLGAMPDLGPGAGAGGHPGAPLQESPAMQQPGATGYALGDLPTAKSSAPPPPGDGDADGEDEFSLPPPPNEDLGADLFDMQIERTAFASLDDERQGRKPQGPPPSASSGLELDRESNVPSRPPSRRPVRKKAAAPARPRRKGPSVLPAVLVGAGFAAAVMGTAVYFAFDDLEALGRSLIGAPKRYAQETLDPALVNPTGRMESADEVNERAEAALGSSPAEALTWLGDSTHTFAAGTELAKGIAQRAYAAGSGKVYVAGFPDLERTRARCLILELPTDPMERKTARKLEVVADTMDMGSLVAVAASALDGMLDSVQDAQLRTPDVGQEYLAICFQGG